MANHAPATRANVRFVQATMPSDAHLHASRRPNDTRLVVDRRAPMYRRGWRTVPAVLAQWKPGSIMWLVAEKFIPAGAEIYIYYGPEYRRILQMSHNTVPRMC